MCCHVSSRVADGVAPTRLNLVHQPASSARAAHPPLTAALVPASCRCRRAAMRLLWRAAWAVPAPPAALPPPPASLVATALGPPVAFLPLSAFWPAAPPCLLLLACRPRPLRFTALLACFEEGFKCQTAEVLWAGRARLVSLDSAHTTVLHPCREHCAAHSSRSSRSLPTPAAPSGAKAVCLP